MASGIELRVIKVAVLTVSDTCSRKEAEDRSGPNLKKIAEDSNGLGADVVAVKIIPDEIPAIKETLIEWCDVTSVDLILTTGGTGFADRDVTPEATKAVLDKEAPGLAIAMLIGSLKVTPLATLSRAVCGIRKKTLIINLPGSLKASQECYGFVQPALRHAIELLRGEKAKVAATHNSLAAARPQNSTTQKHEHHHHHHHHHNHNGSQQCQYNGSVDHYDVSKVARRPRDSPYPLVSYKDAMNIVMQNTPVLAPVVIDFADALGKIIAEDVVAHLPLPPFAASMKDGYAVIASDGPGERNVMGNAAAGCLPEGKLKPDHVIRITTGAPIPDGADAVVQVEHTELVKEGPDGKSELVVKILSTPTPGLDIRPIGNDIVKGSTVLAKGMKLGPPELGLLASVGVTKVRVHRVPTVAVCSTGTELNEPSEDLKPGCIYDSNRTSILAALKENGIPAVDMGIAVDSVDAIRDLLQRAASSADIIVTTGGVSMGEKDLLKYVLSKELKADLHFGRIFLKPGKPTTFATFKQGESTKLFFSLPGNPVSAIVTFTIFVMATVKKMMGCKEFHLRKIKVKIQEDLELDPRPEYPRVSLQWPTADSDGFPVARTTGNQISSRLLSMRQASALLELPPRSEDRTRLAAGSVVDALIIRL